MTYYTLFALQLLLAGLLVWRMRQNSGQPVGCLAGGVVAIVVVVLTSFLFFLGQAVLSEGLIAEVLADSRGSLAAVSPAQWLMVGFLGLILLLMAAGTCSLVGFAFTGHHPEFCKKIWKTLAGVLLLPVVALALLAGAFGFAFIVSMRIASPMFDDIGWGWMLLLVVFSAICLLGFVGFVVVMLDINANNLKTYVFENRDRSFRRIDTTEKGGAQ